ncbi:glycosyltransferase family 4 protein [Hyunsoonleella aestuarii]|uniref:Glycosyltransferase family 1 protein n=1 Tax=Hyunsoonleella aestuarii TaxID=912802 RepID=A0ABP8EDD4_9FLAO|nr:glycosyltransferase family 1 protein [Hyunsoonleella aestuarii]
MRIGIEAQRLFRPHKHGMDIVARELILNLQVIDKENDYFIFVKPDQDKSTIKSTANFKVVEIPGGPYPWWEQFKLPRIAKSFNCDILHCTSNTAPYYKNIPLITTLHDIIYMEGSMLNLLFNKASLYQKFGNLYRRVIVSKVIKNSRRLITVSNFEKENITKYFKLKHKVIKAVHNGVNKTFTVNIDADHIARVKSKYKLPENYFLHIANKDPRKNTKKVLMAFKEFLGRTNSRQKLLMLGYKDAYLKILLNEIGAIDLYDHIILTGYVSDDDLPVIYKLSQLFLFPSLREGFGIPIIEAMACGVPVITSNTSSMPEVAGNAAHLINPNKIEDISSAMLKIVSDENYKNMLIQRGLKRSKEFSWNKMAFQVLEQYKQLYKEINT